MKHRYLCLLFCTAFLLVWNHPVKAATFIQQDTLRQDTICITPYFAKTPVNSLGNFAVSKKDRNAFQTYAGFSILNTLRGHVPNLFIDPNAGNPAAGLRSAASMLVIDGLPYAGTFSQHYNLNTFEYENIYAFSSGNAAIQYGGQASSGVVFLQSKTGKDIFRPSVEFNSSAAFVPEETLGSSTYSEEWQFISAIAYAQDYGATDLRVSYNGSYFPETNAEREMESGINNIRINTGFDITDRLNARLILDGVRRKARDRTQASLGGGELYVAESEALVENLQGNLMLQYQALDWLTITSQSSLAGIDQERESIFPGITDSQVQENRRSFINLFAAAHQSPGNKITLREFAGLQYERQEISGSRHQFSETNSNTTFQNAEYNAESLLAGIGFQYSDFWFADVNYRSDRLSAFSKNLKPGYAITSAFIFSEALNWKDGWFSSGRLRGSYGKTVVPSQEYPGTIGMLGIGATPLSPPYVPSVMERKMTEAGVDVSFFDRRLNFSLSYFHDLDDQTLVVVSMPGPSGYIYTTVDLGEKHKNGWETVLAGNAIKRSNLSLDTKLIWSTFRNYFSQENLLAETYGSITSDWTGSILNQLTVGNFFSTLLVDMRRGGEFYSEGFESPLKINEGTNIKLRDLSIGYMWPEDLAVKTKISLSARNLWTIYAKEKNVETLFYQVLSRESICLSVTVNF